MDLVHDGIDVALRVGAIADETLVARRVLTYRHMLVASPALLDRLGVPNSPDDLHRFPMAVWSGVIGSRIVWKLGDLAFEPQAMLTTTDYMHVREMALAGEAVTELPSFLASRFIEHGQLRPLLVEHPFPEQTVNLLYPSHRYPSTLVRAYLDFCKEHAESYLR